MNVIGVDVSKYEVSYIVNTKGEVTKINDWWSPDKAIKPIDFVIQRVSYGGKHDEMLNLMYSECLKIPIRGAYHYYSSGVKWQTQLETILSAIKGKEYQFFVIDYETAFNNLNATSFAEMTELAKQLKLVVNKRVLLYFNPNTYKTYMRPFNADAIINKNDIWIAQYPYKLFLNLTKGPSLPLGVTKWNFWQYGAGDVPGVAGYDEGLAYGSWRHGIDLDLWNGTLEELYAWLEVTPTDPEPPQPEPVRKEKLQIVIYDDFSITTEELE